MKNGKNAFQFWSTYVKTPFWFYTTKRSRFFFLPQLKDQIDLIEIKNLLKAFNFSKLPKLGKQKLPPIQSSYTTLSFNKFEREK